MRGLLLLLLFFANALNAQEKPLFEQIDNFWKTHQAVKIEYKLKGILKILLPKDKGEFTLNKEGDFYIKHAPGTEREYLLAKFGNDLTELKKSEDPANPEDQYTLYKDRKELPIDPFIDFAAKSPLNFVDAVRGLNSIYESAVSPTDFTIRDKSNNNVIKSVDFNLNDRNKIKIVLSSKTFGLSEQIDIDIVSITGLNNVSAEMFQIPLGPKTRVAIK